MEETVIEIENLSKNYGGIQALKDISLTVKKGELFGIIGPNGAGKTTLFRVMLGLTRPASGRIRVKGLDVSATWSRELRAHTGYLPEDIVFYDHMTGIETLRFYARIKGASEKEVWYLLDKVGLSGAAKRVVGKYSKGMRQRLGLAQALLGSPDILFLDEPTSGLDPEGIGTLYSILRDIKGEGVTVIMTSHILKEVQDRVDRLGIIGGGKLLAYGTVREMRNSLGLKPTVHLTLKGDGEAVKEIVSEAGGESFSREGNRFTFHCSQENKMKVVKAVMCKEGNIADIELVEPSLEDVFMEYVGTGNNQR